MSEAQFKKRLMAQLKTIPNSWWESINQRSIIGTPDIIGCVNGCFVAIECKSSEKARIAPMQAHKLELIRGAGGVGMVVWPGKIIEIIDSINILKKY